MQSGSSTARRVKEQQAKHWNSVADGWSAWLAWTEQNFHPITEWFIKTGGLTAGAVTNAFMLV